METLKQLWLDYSPTVINFGIAMAVLQAFYFIAGVALAIGLGSEELAGREVEGFLGKIRGD